jgi:hypothetical protein
MLEAIIRPKEIGKKVRLENFSSAVLIVGIHSGRCELDFRRIMCLLKRLQHMCDTDYSQVTLQVDNMARLWVSGSYALFQAVPFLSVGYCSLNREWCNAHALSSVVEALNCLRDPQKSFYRSCFNFYEKCRTPAHIFFFN